MAALGAFVGALTTADEASASPLFLQGQRERLDEVGSLWIHASFPLGPISDIL